jgi:hypothetical protein
MRAILSSPGVKQTMIGFIQPWNYRLLACSKEITEERGGGGGVEEGEEVEEDGVQEQA